MLEAKHLSVLYGRHRALEKVSVHVDRGEICVILGANGAGKSTLLKVIAGLIRCEAGGSVSVDGACIASMQPSDIVERGIALVPEGGAIFGELTVAENLTLGAYPARARSHQTANLKRVCDLFPALARRRRQVARTMSGGEQKMLAIARALMSNPDILMLDEPSLGLSPLLSTELFKTLKAIGASGVGILLVEQNANQSLKIADRGYLLENGHIVGEDNAMALASNPAVRRAYLGADTEMERLGEPAAAIPPPLGLAELSPAEIARRAGQLAARAGAIHAAHVSSARTSRPAPNAFADHTGARRTASAAEGAPPSDAAELGRMAGALAERAAAIHTAHIKSMRQARAAERMSAPSATASTQSVPDAATLTRMAEAFASRATESGRGVREGPEGDRPGQEAIRQSA